MAMATPRIQAAAAVAPGSGTVFITSTGTYELRPAAATICFVAAAPFSAASAAADAAHAPPALCVMAFDAASAASAASRSLDASFARSARLIRSRRSAASPALCSHVVVVACLRRRLNLRLHLHVQRPVLIGLRLIHLLRLLLALHAGERFVLVRRRLCRLCGACPLACAWRLRV